MDKVAKVIYNVGRISGYNDKMAYLKRHGDLPGLKAVLKFIYNPYCKTGISNAKLSKAMAYMSSQRTVTFVEVVEYFKTHQTGSDEDLCFARDFISSCKRFFGDEAAQLGQAIVTQDLKIGITSTTLNRVFGDDFIPKTGCMLGTLYGDIGYERVKWPCIVTEKLDGVRRVLVKENGVCRFYSRSGHEDTGLVEILEEAKQLPDNYVYDGELLAKGSFKDSIAQRQATNSIANAKGVKTGLTFNVFDMVPTSDFYAGLCTIPALERKIRLAATFNDDSLSLIDEEWAKRICAFGMYADLQHIATVPILGLVKNLVEATPIVEAIWERGGEGIMLNTTVGPYEIKRSKHLVKVKHTEEYILQVTDVFEGSGKYENSMGSIVVDYKGHAVGVGSGFTDDQRAAIWDNPKAYIGRMVEVETFGESTNAQGAVSLNCPIFKRFLGEVE